MKGNWSAVCPTGVPRMADLPPEAWRTLRTDPWFGSVPADLAEWLVAHAALKALHPGQHLYFRGDLADGMYGVLAGILRVSSVTETGKEMVLSFLEAPTWFGEIALFDQLPRTHDTSADTAATLLHVNRRDLEALLAEQPQHWRVFGRLMALKTRLAFLGLEDLAVLPPEGRLARRLLWMMRATGGGTRDRRASLGINQSNLALMLSMSRQTANTVLMVLQSKGILRVKRGAIDVLDEDGLAEVAGLSAPERRLLQSLVGEPARSP